MAWAALCGIPEKAVRTAFYYVRAGATVSPDELPGPDELAALFPASGSDSLAGPVGQRYAGP
jgi:DNA helicase-2/ATP-dependent DNA helicase PcrA